MAPEAAPNKTAAPTTHSLLSTTMQTGRSLESSQIQYCSSGKLSKAFHTSTATVTAVRRELCFRKAKNHNNNYYEREQTGFGRSTALFSSARSRMTSRISPWCATLVWSTHGLVSAFFSHGEAVWGEPAQYISMRATETTVVVPNGSHYRDSQLYYTL